MYDDHVFWSSPIFEYVRTMKKKTWPPFNENEDNMIIGPKQLKAGRSVCVYAPINSGKRNLNDFLFHFFVFFFITNIVNTS